MRIGLAVLVLLAAFGSDAAQTYVRRWVPQMGLGGQDSWILSSNSTSYPYFFNGYVYRNFTGTSQITAALGETLSAGTWYAWFKLENPSSLTIQLGDFSNTVSKTSTRLEWTRSEAMTPTASFSNAVLTFVAGTAVTKRFHGLIITDDPWLMQVEEADGVKTSPGTADATHDVTYSADLFFRKPEQTVETNYQSGNLVRFGTFEFGSTDWGTPYEDTRTAGPRYRGPRRDRWIEGADMPQGRRAIGIWSTAAGTNTLPGWTHMFEVRREPGLQIAHTVSFYARSQTNTISLGVQVIPMLLGTTSRSATNVWNLTNTTYDVTVSIPASTNWNRYSFTVPLDTSPSPYYRLQFDHTSGDVLFIDGLMVNEGESAEDFAPRSPAEFVIRGANIGNLYDLTDDPEVQVWCYNTGAEFERTLEVTEHGPNGEVLTNYVQTMTVATGLGTNTFNLRSGKRGPIRVIARAADMPNDQEEDVFTILALGDPTDAPLVNSLIGSHVEPDVAEVELHRKLHIDWSRSLMNQYFEADDQWPDPGSAFDWAIADHEIGQQTNILILASIGDHDKWPSHIVSSSFPAYNEAGRTNWAGTISSRYPALAAIEAENEPQYSTNYTKSATNWLTLWRVHELDLAGITNANDQPYVGFGGINGITTFPSNAWDQMVAKGTTNKIDSISMHVYADGGEIGNWNTLAGTEADIDNWHLFGKARGVRVRGTESGAYNWAGAASQWFLVDPDQYIGWQDYLPQLQLIRGLYFDHLRFMTMWRHVGRGMQYFYYASRNSLQPWNWDSGDGIRRINDSLKPSASILGFAAGLLGEATALGRITNASAANLELYALDAACGALVIAWDQQAGEVLTGTLTNSNFGVFDWWGNVIQTNNASIEFSHQPRYLVSSVLSAGQLQETVLEATLTHFNDSEGAVLSVLNSPHGPAPAAPYRFRWLAVAPKGLNPDRRYPEAINTRYRLRDSDSWSAWGTRGQLLVSSLEAGNYALQVEALASGVTNSISGPSFTIGTPEPAPSAQLSISNLVVESWSFAE